MTKLKSILKYKITWNQTDNGDDRNDRNSTHENC